MKLCIVASKCTLIFSLVFAVVGHIFATLKLLAQVEVNDLSFYPLGRPPPMCTVTSPIYFLLQTESLTTLNVLATQHRSTNIVPKFCQKVQNLGIS